MTNLNDAVKDALKPRLLASPSVITKSAKRASAGDCWRSVDLGPNKTFDLLVCQPFAVEGGRLGAARQHAPVMRSKNPGAEIPFCNLFQNLLGDSNMQ
jgi:hypothetical protein